MRSQKSLPRILIVDDLFGRTLKEGRNIERANLCGQFLIEDITGDEKKKGTPQLIKRPIAQAVFCRGQIPNPATVGDRVENDLDGTLETIRMGWEKGSPYHPKWALILLDLCFYTGQITEKSYLKIPGMPIGHPTDSNPINYFGLKLLKEIHRNFPNLPVVILSSKPRQEVSHEFSQYGALGFLPRSDPHSPEILKEFLWKHGLIPDESGIIIGHSKKLLLALRTARRAALDQRNILIRGKRGTGKGLMARYIHHCSSKIEERPFVIIDSGTLTPSLYASELFGHIKGAFTDAKGTRVGKIISANRGDLFFDEIGNIPSDVQKGLLLVLENGEVSPVGSTSAQSVNVRFLSATNENIEDKIEAGNFRADLFDRLKRGGTVSLPPLRERKEDIPILVNKFVKETLAAVPGSMERDIDPKSIEKLISYNWPGNIRELEDCIINAIKNNPDVEHLVPVHIILPITTISQKKEIEEEPISTIQDEHNSVVQIDEALNIMRKIDFLEIDPANLAGKLPMFESSFAWLAANLLEAALEATKRRTPDNPEGRIQIHPAIKLLMGDNRISASKAADIVKRLLSLDRNATDLLLQNQTLKESYETALRLRPRK